MDLAASVAALAALEQALTAAFVERDDVIHGLLLGLVAQEHVALIGPPGTGKTLLAQRFAEALDLRFWSTLLTRFGTPEDLFGPLSVAGLEHDRYYRIAAGRLPEAEVALIDEFFKANDALLHTLLPVLHERVWYDDGQRKPLPLQLLLAASNEWPTDPELAAVWDRLALRYVVGPIRDPDTWEQWLTQQAQGGALPPLPSVPADAVAAVRRAAAAVDATPAVPLLAQVKQALAARDVTCSDRRWATVMRLLRAEAALQGRSVVQADDVVAVMPALWARPEDIPSVTQVVLERCAPTDQEAQIAFDKATEVYHAFRQAEPAQQLNPRFIQETLQHLTRALKDLERARFEAVGRQQQPARIDRLLARVHGYLDRVTQTLRDLSAPAAS